MSKVDGPRHGSMQFWPRRRAKSETARVRARHFVSDVPVDGFCGYKVGMTTVMLKDTKAKNLMHATAATVIECPPLKVAGIRFYSSQNDVLVPTSDVFSDKPDKELSKSMIVPKAKDVPADGFDDLRLIVYTQPKLTSLGKKKPEVFEMGVGGSKEEKLAYAKEKLGKEITLSEIFKPQDLIDIHAVTKGKGYQGPVKRFGIQIRARKSEKTKRGPGSLGPWCGQQHIMYRVAHAGQTGYHTRMEFNKAIVSISDDPATINPTGGFVRYGEVKNPYLLILGSVAGPRKRLIRMHHAMRPNPKTKRRATTRELTHVSTLSKQG